MESRNVHLELFIDRFNPFCSFVASYSYWSMILTVYNLLPRICMRQEFMFLSMVIPGPNNPGHNINVYLHPLKYDVSMKQNF